MPSNLPTAIKLENASNLRDLGGWPTTDGKHVRFGVIFRAPAMGELSESDIATVAALGIRTVCDFRGEREGTARPVRIAGARHQHLPIEPSVGGSLRDIMRTGEITGHTSPEEILSLMRDAYQAYALQNFSQYRAMFNLLLADETIPLLFHCAAGKDRTGFGAALLLTALGVAWDDVVADYLATNRLWRRESVSFNLESPLKDALFSAHASLLSAAFAAVNGAYGSTDAYLQRAIGLDAQRKRDLRARLTA